MQRRSLLKLGTTSAIALAAIGGAALWMHTAPDGSRRLTPEAHTVFTAMARAVLDGSLPEPPAQRLQALQALSERIEILVAHLPPHAQDELAQLLGLLATIPGRRLLAEVATPWPDAPPEEVAAGLQSMRTSRLVLRRQAYQALHDIIGGAYFSESATWSILGYPGPSAQVS